MQLNLKVPVQALRAALYTFPLRTGGFEIFLAVHTHYLNPPDILTRPFAWRVQLTHHSPALHPAPVVSHQCLPRFLCSSQHYLRTPCALFSVLLLGFDFLSATVPCDQTELFT